MKFSFKEIKRRIYIFAAVIFVLIAGIIYILKNNGKTADRNMADNGNEVIISEENGTETPTDESSASKTEETIVVHVCGAVRCPGIYELGSGDRIADAIEAAGGFSDDAATDYLNLAEHISDGDKIEIFTKKQIKKMQSEDKSDHTGSDDHDNLTDINSAGIEELMNLPGIGESKAKAIISYREENGPFKNVDELMNIPGIKEGVMSKIRDVITAR